MLRRLRQAKGWTQADLAKRARVVQPYIAQLERGTRTPSLAVLRRLARALGVPVAVLL